MSFSRRGRALFVCVLAISFALVSFATNDVSAQGNGAIYFSPSSGQHEVGDTFAVSVRMNTGGVPVNAAEGSIVYDTDRLEVRSVSKAGSIFTLWTTEPSFSNADGSVTFGGGLPNPGYSGAGGQIITINFRAKAATTVKGSTEVVLVSGALLENDGSGTNILQSLGRATFYIAPAGVVTTPPPSTGGQVAAPTILSATHPDQAAWYSNANPVFTWEVPAGVQEVRLVLAENQNAAPRVRYAPPIGQKTLPDVGDGHWFFRAQFVGVQGQGPIATYAFNVDVHPPEPFAITKVDGGDATDPRPRILFSAIDRASGVDHYALQIDGGAWTTIPADLGGKPFALPRQVPGTHQVAIKAIDRASNEAMATVDLVVASIATPTITEFPDSAAAHQPFELAGRGIPGTKIHFFAVSEGVALSELKDLSELDAAHGSAVVDDRGDWRGSVQIDHAGKYAVYGIAEDTRGALSQRSNTVQVTVANAPLQAVLAFLKHLIFGIRQPGTGWFIASLLFYLLLFSLLAHLAWRLIRQFWYGIKRRQTDEAKLPARVRTLLNDIEDDLALLDRIARSRPLYPEEKYLRTKLLQYRKTVKFLSTDTHSRLAKKK